MIDIVELLREKSRLIAPEYPNIQDDLEPWEHLWAITASYEGTSLANDDLHAYIKFLLGHLGWTLPEGIEKYKTFQGNKNERK